MLRAQAGERVALDLLVRRWHGALRRQVARQLVDPELARDAVQDAWCAIVRGLRRLDDPARFPAWSLRIAAAAAVDVLRRRGRIARSEAAAAGAAGVDVEPAAAVPVDEAAALRAAVAALDRDHRVVVELCYLENLAVHEVGEVLGIPAGTVKSRLFHARARMRAWLQQRGFGRDAAAERPRSP